MNRGEIRDLARKRLGETTGAFWSDAELNGWIDDGHKDIARRTKCLKDTAYITTTAVSSNTAGVISSEWDLRGACVNCLAVTNSYFHMNGEKWIQLESKTKNDLNIEIPNWMDGVGYTLTVGTASTYNYENFASVPAFYYWDNEENIIGLYPPTDAYNATTNNLKVEFVKAPDDFAADVDECSLPEGLHNGVVYYVSAIGSGTRGWGDKENDFWQKYYSIINDYIVERKREREDDEIIMKPIQNMR